MSKNLKPVKNNKKGVVGLSANLMSYHQKESEFVLNIISTESYYEGIPFTQILLNFLETYQKTYEIQIHNIETNVDGPIRCSMYVEPDDGNYFSATVMFSPSNSNSSFATIVMDNAEIIEENSTTMKFDDSEDGFSQAKFNFFMLDLFSAFTKKSNVEMERKYPNDFGLMYYPCRTAKIDGVKGYLVEFIPGEFKDAALYHINKDCKDGIINVYGVTHNGKKYDKPYEILLRSFNNRWGLFITTITNGEELFKKRDKIRLTSKNMKGTSDTGNLFEVLKMYREKFFSDEED